ncbi:MAG: glutathione synthase [Planctomycetes bacterium]|nr:glutathione synthase [Planctomycetota bacterium]
MNFVFLMDPLETVIAHKDTSLIFMVGAVRAGHRCFYLPPGGLSMDGARMRFRVRPVKPVIERASFPFEVEAWTELTDEQVDAVIVRTEPPFAEQYLMDTWMLDRLPERIAIVNSPRGLRTVNEKLWATRFVDLVPTTLVTRDRTLYRQFIAERDKAVAKPTDAKGGEGVFIVKRGDTNANVIFDTLSHNGKREVIVQEYLPAAEQGDKRILLLGGEILSQVMRVHSKDDHRNNFFAGGKAAPAELTPRDIEICRMLKPHMIELGLHFVGIDVIGEHLIEVNVTSPTCVQECNRLYGQQLEDRVIAYIESLIPSPVKS